MVAQQMNNVIQLDTIKLGGIAKSSGTATEVMLQLASRERNARNGFTNLLAFKAILLREGKKVDDNEYLKFWQDLEAAGIGNYIVGRRGQPDRFKWHYHVKDIAVSAIEGKPVEARPIFAAVKRVYKASKRPGRPRSRRGPGRPKGYSPVKAQGKLTKGQFNQLMKAIKSLAK